MPTSIVAGSTLGALVSEPDFFDCWVASELGAAQQRLGRLMYDDGAAWQVASQRDAALMVRALLVTLPRC